MKLQEIIEMQRQHFNSNATKPIQLRIKRLVKLYKTIKRYETEILEALKADLNKSRFEGYATEVGMVLEELKYTINHLEGWARPKMVPTSIVHFPSVSMVHSEPYGVVLIMSPWNYPFLLSMDPVIGAVAAGNCFVLKPSAYSAHTSEIINTIIAEVFEPECGAVVLGGREENKALLDERFDYIFFTGSTEVGKQVMKSAAKHLTPVSLELGGKSPCIVDETAHIKLAAKRIVWGKFLNAGQTCVAPDYVYVHASVKDRLVSEMKRYVTEFFGLSPLTCSDYPKIINAKHYERLCKLMDGETILAGGECDPTTNKIAPTLLGDIGWASPVMREEIFGPILPIMTYTDIKDVVTVIKSKDKPLALYLFTTSDGNKKRVLGEISYGGGCVNDTIVHIASSYLPFGGVGSSGMGNYHGKYSFETFSHKKAVLTKSNALDIFLRYPPYRDHLKWLKVLMK